jgi:2-polyprenyl-6-methoxyphenol hydroxylase-like FAD-dependent oxidoreductase
VNIAVIGAGPAGLIAAALLSKRGESVTLIDERAEAGGHLRYDRYPVGSDRHKSDSWLSELGSALDLSGATVLQSAIVWAAFRVGNHFELAVNHAGAEQTVRADHLVISTGTTDLPLVIPGATLPGVMTSRAVRILLNLHGVLPGQRLFVAGLGPVADRLKGDLTAAGAEATVVAPGTIAAVAGERGVESIRLTNGSSIEADCLIIARGEAPDLQLAGMLDAPRIYDPAIEGWRLASGAALPEVTVIGGALLGAASPDQVAQSAVEAVDRIAPTGPVPGEIRLDITDAILRWEAIQG